MRFFNRGGGTINTIVGLFLLVLLAVFVGPNMLPRLVSSFTPFIDESIPCIWLRPSQDRAFHQSLLGRAAENPLRLEVRTSTAPQQPDGTLNISIVVINDSLGTIPIIYEPNQVIFGDNGSSGLGLIFTPAYTRPGAPIRQDATAFAQGNNRVLGPRQRCIHRVSIPYSQLDGAILNGQSQVRAFYRITNAGAINVAANVVATPIFRDQGLDIVAGGYIESPGVPIPLAFAGP